MKNKIIISMCIVHVFGWIVCGGMIPSVRAQFLFKMPSQIGQSASDFRLTNVRGQMMTLSELRDGRPAVILFWATWCPMCQGVLKDLNKRQTEIAQKGAQLVLVSTGEDSGTVNRYLKRKGYDFEVFLDEDQKYSYEYGIEGIPTLFFVDKEGMIRGVKHELPKDWESFF